MSTLACSCGQSAPPAYQKDMFALTSAWNSIKVSLLCCLHCFFKSSNAPHRQQGTAKATLAGTSQGFLMHALQALDCREQHESLQ